MKQDALAWPNSRSQERNSDLKTNRLISRPVQRSCEGGRLSFGRLQTFRARTGLAQSLEGPDSCRMAIRELQVQAVSTGGFSSDNSKALGNRIRIQDRFTSPFIHTGSTFAGFPKSPVGIKTLVPIRPDHQQGCRLEDLHKLRLISGIQIHGVPFDLSLSNWRQAQIIPRDQEIHTLTGGSCEEIWKEKA